MPGIKSWDPLTCLVASMSQFKVFSVGKVLELLQRNDSGKERYVEQFFLHFRATISVYLFISYLTHWMETFCRRKLNINMICNLVWLLFLSLILRGYCYSSKFTLPVYRGKVPTILKWFLFAFFTASCAADLSLIKYTSWPNCESHAQKLI